MKKLIFNFLILLSLFISVSAQSKKAQKFYEFTNYENCEEVKIQVDKFSSELRANLSLTPYVIYYGGKNSYSYNPKINKREIILPQQNEAKARTLGFINDYMIESRIGKKIALLDGGYRENYTVQFWIIPEGANIPKLNPTVKLEDIKFRKGKYIHHQGEGC